MHHSGHDRDLNGAEEHNSSGRGSHRPTHRRSTRRGLRSRGIVPATAVLAPVLLAVGLLPATAAAPDGDDRGPGPRFGSSVSRTAGEDYPDAKDRITKDFGEPGVMRIYSSGMPTPWSSIRTDLGGDAPFVVSFKAAPREVLSGRLDGQLKAWFAAAPTNRRTFWSYYHEPEDNIARGEFSAADYRAAWAHLADLATTADNRLLRPTLILMTWSLNPASHRDWHDYYAEGSVKVLGWDGYNPYESQGRYATPAEMFDRARAASESVGRPWGIAEFGSQLAKGDSGKGRAKWLLDCAAYLRNHDIRFVTYFDAIFVGENDFRLRDQDSRSAWRTVVSGS